MTASTPDSTLPDWRVTLAFGLLLIVLGTVGLYLSVFVTLASVLLFGGFLIAGGVLHGIEVFRKQDRRKGTRLENLLIALIYIGMGLLIAYDPVAASAGLTLMIAGLFAAMGAIRLTHAWQRRNEARGEAAWHAVSGIIELALALIITLHWPISGLWVIGLLVSVEMIMNGWLLVFAAFAIRKAARGESVPAAAG